MPTISPFKENSLPKRSYVMTLTHNSLCYFQFKKDGDTILPVACLLFPGFTGGYRTGAIILPEYLTEGRG